jgi:hypothetical protein
MIQRICIPRKSQLYRVVVPFIYKIREDEYNMGHILKSLGYFKPNSPASYRWNYWGSIDPQYIRLDNDGKYVELVIPENLHIILTINSVRNLLNIRVSKKYNKHMTDVWKTVSQSIPLDMTKCEILIEDIPNP